MEQRKHRRGDRKDAYILKDLDSMHLFTPYLMPKRTENEAMSSESFDLEPILKYLENKNSADPDFKYTIFHVICAAIAKTVELRPHMNWFIAGNKMYERKDISFSFVVKKKFQDDAHEALAIMKMDRDSDKPPIEQVHDKVKHFVTDIREHDVTDDTTGAIDFLTKLPGPILRFVMFVLSLLERNGLMPLSLINEDPYYSTVFISNLGSIKTKASYHHLVNWGTNSFFVIINKKEKRPFFSEDGTFEMREMLDIGMTIDERIADGIYFAKSIEVFRKILEDPSLLELPLKAPID